MKRSNGLTLSFFIKFNSASITGVNGIKIKLVGYLEAYIKIINSTLVRHGLILGSYSASTAPLYQSVYHKITYAATVQDVWLFYVVTINSKDNKIYITEEQKEFSLMYFTDLTGAGPNGDLEIRSFIDNRASDIMLVKELKMSMDYKPYMWKLRNYNIKDSKNLIFYYSFSYYYYLDGAFKLYNSSAYVSQEISTTYAPSILVAPSFADTVKKFINCGINEYWYDVCTSKIIILNFSQYM